MSNAGTCRDCGDAILWVKTAPAKSTRLEPRKQSEPRPGLVCVNPKTGVGKVLKGEDVEDAYRWLKQGATLHRFHMAVCPEARKQREAKKQDKQVQEASDELERVLMKFPELDH